MAAAKAACFFARANCFCDAKAASCASDSASKAACSAASNALSCGRGIVSCCGYRVEGLTCFVGLPMKRAVAAWLSASSLARNRLFSALAAASRASAYLKKKDEKQSFK